MSNIIRVCKLPTERELFAVAKNNSWTVGDVLSAYTGLVKITGIIEYLKDNGDISTWSLDCACDEKEIISNIVKYYNKPANLRVYRHLPDIDVIAIITLGNLKLHMFMEVDNESSNKSFEMRLRKLESILLR